MILELVIYIDYDYLYIDFEWNYHFYLEWN